jgi:DNA invertase Pin-like site-specific DNA recombinase
MKYFIYARKSTDDEERQILSIDAQLDELRMLAAREKLEVVREYIESQTAKKLADRSSMKCSRQSNGARLKRF